jgi:HSP20 family protein
MVRYPSQGRFPLSALDWLDEVWSGSDATQGQVMPMDVRETDSGYVVEAGLPGIKPEEVEITLDGRLLTIRGRSTDKRDHDEGRYLLRERRSTSMSRSVTLPAEIDADGVTTTFEDGELRVTLPISKRAGSRRIPVGAGAAGARQVSAASDGGTPQNGLAGDAGQPTPSAGGDGQRRAEPANATASNGSR